MTVYDDALQSPFADWSWATHDLQATAPVHAGTFAISMEPAGWSGLYFHHPGISVAANGVLTLWVHGGADGGQQLRFYLYRNQAYLADAPLTDFIPGGAIPAGSWVPATIPFAAMGVLSGTIDGLVLQADAAGTQPTVYLDDLVLLDTAGPPPPVTISVDPGADRRPINPLIYGVSLGSGAEFGSLGYTVRRWGGNAVTRYNWRKDATNHASDWFYINLPEGPDSTGLPDGSSADSWMDETIGAGAVALVTVPTIGWTARDRVKRWGFSIAAYGDQQENECTASGWPSWCEADAGNGIWVDGSPVTGNDPHDTSVEIGPSFVTDWLEHIIGRLGGAGTNGVRFYALDNEPMLWNSTHRDVHPDPLDLDGLWAYTQIYAEAIKSVDPAAEVLGPVVWGWCAYFYSALDGCTPGPDMAAHDGLPLLEWYLQQNRERELQTGSRPIDYLDVHYYPQALGVALNDDESVAALRLRSLRSLYDPDYVDESWIGQPVRLIPRMKEWIAARCPGVKLAITEYNWGGDQGISSALAQAEALAIFGREGVDLATRWVAPELPSKVREAYRLYLDYDGAGGRLLGQSVRAQSSDVDQVGSYAILRDEGSLALLLFNKAAMVLATQVTVAGAVAGAAPLYRFDASSALGPVGDFAVPGPSFSIDLPARSATLMLVPLGGTGSTTEVPGGSDRLELTAEPCPFRSVVSLRIESTAPLTAGAVEIWDVTGRLLRRLEVGEGMTGKAGPVLAVTWDGRTVGGGEAPSGVYFLRVRMRERVATARVMKIQ